ncbi:hypothetical protein [Paenibacillus sp. NPDC058071]|uniref:hypothetical protein n=1 Tax=Paenibacillus sp. NPDC058071 TaxID=3346326 RepID=UPI0036DF76E9
MGLLFEMVVKKRQSARIKFALQQSKWEGPEANDHRHTSKYIEPGTARQISESRLSGQSMEGEYASSSVEGDNGVMLRYSGRTQKEGVQL